MKDAGDDHVIVTGASNALFQAYSVFNYIEDDEMCARGIDWVIETCVR